MSDKKINMDRAQEVRAKIKDFLDQHILECQAENKIPKEELSFLLAALCDGATVIASTMSQCASNDPKTALDLGLNLLNDMSRFMREQLAIFHMISLKNGVFKDNLNTTNEVVDKKEPKFNN